MSRFNDTDDPRRRVLIQALAAGAFFVGIPAGQLRAADFFGSRPYKLPEGQSIYRITGNAQVNGAPATMQTRITASDTVETAKDSELVFVVGGNAMILRESSRIELQAEQIGSIFISGLRLLTGKLLSVSRNRSMRVQTMVATIGIRGTGFYLESDPQQSYFCTCYGTSEVTANHDQDSKETVESEHHNKPLYILANAQRGQSIRNAPFVNHSDQELMLIETLVGRTPPFVFPDSRYNGPQRDY